VSLLVPVVVRSSRLSLFDFLSFYWLLIALNFLFPLNPVYLSTPSLHCLFLTTVSHFFPYHSAMQLMLNPFTLYPLSLILIPALEIQFGFFKHHCFQ